LIAIIVVAAIGAGASYAIWRINLPPPEDIKIGICADIDGSNGRNIYQGVQLAVEQLNAEGGLLGRNLTVVTQDDDSTSAGSDPALVVNALTKLITVDKADFLVTSGANTLVQQDTCSQHKKILFTIGTTADEHTQRVLDDYDKYKYYFRPYMPNATSMNDGHIQGLLGLKNYTGFTKIALLLWDSSAIRKQTIPQFQEKLPKLGFNTVYTALLPAQGVDYSSYFAAAEEAGAEIIFTIFVSGSRSPAFVKEWYDRQSPTVMWGEMYGAGDPNYWNLTEGKVEFVSFSADPVMAGYPLTSKTMATREAYIERWDKQPFTYAVAAYDTVRFILADAIRRAGTIETEAVIKALETTNVETSMAARFAFTSSHDVLVGEAGIGNLGEAHMLYSIWQWQDQKLLPVFPDELRREAGVTYKLPPWPGPWTR
jgi:branched-chain amino acid transport system substrate-binding protein